MESDSHTSTSSSPNSGAQEIDLFDLFRAIWESRWLIVLVAGVFAVAAISYALVATEFYRAEVLLSPAEEKTAQGLAAQFGSLASLAGISVGGGSSAEPIAILKSRSFAGQFIEENQLLPILFADEWDAPTGKWKSLDPDDQPDLRDAVRMFNEQVRKVDEDTKTGLVTISIEWTDPQVAADWANELVQRLNDRMRERALLEAQANVRYLQGELATTNVVTLQQSIGRLLETELQKLMLAKGNDEFAFRVVDRAEPPKLRSKPKRTLIVILATVLGGIVSVLAVLMRQAYRERRGAGTNVHGAETRLFEQALSTNRTT